MNELERGLLSLMDIGLVSEAKDRLYLTSELQALLDTDRQTATAAVTERWLRLHAPLWIHTATTPGGIATELIPEADARRLAGLLPDPEEREALLLAVGSKVQAQADAELGAEGERFILDRCQITLAGEPDLAAQVRHVSLISDALGYDIAAPNLHGRTQRLEVKASRRPGSHLSIFLSRNEAQTGHRDPNWALVVCRQHPDGSFETLGWCRYTVIATLLPTDAPAVSTGRGRWSSVHLSLPLKTLNEGLPLTAEAADGGVSEDRGATY